MYSSFNDRIKPPMIGGLPLYLVIALVGAGIFGWLFVLLFNQLPINFLMGFLFVTSLAFGVYVLKNHSDWLMLSAKRASNFEQSAELYKELH